MPADFCSNATASAANGSVGEAAIAISVNSESLRGPTTFSS